MLRRTPPAGLAADRPHTLSVARFEEDGSSAEVTVRLESDTAAVGLAAPPAAPVVADVHDDTWAKVRLDAETVAALPDLLPRIGDPLTRAAVWNALAYAVDDAELDPRLVLDVLAAALPHETQDVGLSAMLGWATTTVRGRYLAPGQGDARVADLATAVLDNAAPGGGAQLAAARAVAATAAEPDLLRGWLDGAAPDGLAVDVDLRWALLWRLCVLGAADHASIDAERERDPAAEGAVHAARCRAALPTAEAKEAAWDLITGDAQVSNYVLYATCEGFWAPEQQQVTQRYIGRYFSEVPETTRFRSGWVVGETARLAFPVYAVSADTVRLAEQVLGQDLAPGVRRSVADRAHDLQRAVEVRRRFGG